MNKNKNKENISVFGYGKFGQAMMSVLLHNKHRLDIDGDLYWYGKGDINEYKKRLTESSLKNFGEHSDLVNGSLINYIREKFWWANNDKIILDTVIKSRGDLDAILNGLLSNIDKIDLNKNIISITGDENPDAFNDAVNVSDNHIIALNSQGTLDHYRESILPILDDINDRSLNVLVTSKGGQYQDNTFRNPVEVLMDDFKGTKHKANIISGPNFAAEIVDKNHTKSSIVGSDKDSSDTFVNFLENDYFKPHTEDPENLRAVVLGGVLKNALAILAGYMDTISISSMERSKYKADIFKMLKDITVDLGFDNTDSLDGPHGLGDLMMCCELGSNSRNYRAGTFLANGLTESQIKKKLGVVEGFNNLKVLDHIIDLNTYPDLKKIFGLLEHKIDFVELQEEIISKNQENLDSCDKIKPNRDIINMIFLTANYLNYCSENSKNTQAAILVDLFAELKKLLPHDNIENYLPEILCDYYETIVEDENYYLHINQNFRGFNIKTSSTLLLKFYSDSLRSNLKVAPKLINFMIKNLYLNTQEKSVQFKIL